MLGALSRLTLEVGDAIIRHKRIFRDLALGTGGTVAGSGAGLEIST